jgi:hypothetical protein
MTSVVSMASMLAMLVLTASAGAQTVVDHAHMHGMQATPPPGPPPAAPGGGRGGPQIEVPWNDAIPPGTAEHAARALKDSSRHGEWADVTLPDGGVLKSWVVYPERAQKAGVVLMIQDMSDSVPPPFGPFPDRKSGTIAMKPSCAS